MFQNIPRSRFDLREASHIDFVHEKRHMDVFLGTPFTPPLETLRTFFNSAEAPEALFILQALGLSVVYKSTNIHLGQGQDLIMNIQIFLKYEYTDENA